MNKTFKQKEIIEWNEYFIDAHILRKKFSFKLISREDDKQNIFDALVINQTLSMDKKASHLTIILEGQNLEKEISLVNIENMTTTN
ncbi:hypothetical protein [Ulvibacter litoralis]|uniref:Uncharacterized protein n=1 Tax=Ulvibacter litoralis TaxID=227084 RepID=A0A1G7JNG8_9FLAO|nr:hypothetical protein [Ulvibacter litoralis]GHC65472.1 hypothetical protein GCM10008083_33350 [Ulvibacter litoralis]SDF26009.1 hypothetical protein SAMN05421855_1194 [Ulvibacter litoralis]